MDLNSISFEEIPSNRLNLIKTYNETLEEEPETASVIADMLDMAITEANRFTEIRNPLPYFLPLRQVALTSRYWRGL